MSNTKRTLLVLLMLVFIAALGAFGFTSCNTNSSYNVTFMVQENPDDAESWLQYTTVTSESGKVTLPSAPAKEYFSFRNWYLSSDFSGEPFTGEKVNSDLTVYARYMPVTVEITVGDETRQEQLLKQLSEMSAEYEAAAREMDLTFDAWYTDTGFNTKYDSSSMQNPTALYGRYMASVAFYNGYETLYTASVQAGLTMTRPDQDPSVEGFVKYYMDEEDISYVDEEGNVVDFDQFTVNKNTTLTVLWKSPYLRYSLVSGTVSDYICRGLYYGGSITATEYRNIQRFPVLSVLSKNVTIDGEKGCTVVGVVNDGSGVNVCPMEDAVNASKVIFHEGIQYISQFAFQAGNTAKVEEVVLPSTLKVLENSFWATSTLKSLTLPEGLEVIIDCFWGNWMSAVEGSYRGTTNFGFDIAIPSTVNTLSVVPTNLTFEEGSPYYYEGNRLYCDRTIGGTTYKTLVSDYQSNVVDGTVTVPEGVQAVQVGVFKGMDFSYLQLPSSFKAVSYNSNAENKSYSYNFYIGNYLTDMQRVDNPDAAASQNSYAIFYNLGDSEFQYVIIDSSSAPSGMSEYAFTAGRTAYTELDTDKVVFIGEIDAGNSVNIKITATNTRDSSEKYTNILTGKVSGDSLTEEEILNAVGLKAEEYSYTLTELGNLYVEGVVNHNLYLAISFTKVIGGFLYEVNADGTSVTVTGFHEASAEDIGGVYRIDISAEVDGYTVTGIADGAFKGNNKIAEVYIASTVKTIGAEAFMNASNIELVNVAEGGLEYIGKSAFENVGCVYNSTAEAWEVNADISTVTMMVPLANLVTIEPYAFKSKAIKSFTPVASEESRCLSTIMMSIGLSGLKENMFVYANAPSGDFRSIVKYDGILGNYTKQNASGEETQITLHNVQLYAIAGGADYSNGSKGLAIGFSYRYFEAVAALYWPDLANNVFSYEIMEGSCYFGGSNLTIYMGMVTRIHAGAFTDMEDETPTVYTYNCTYDQWITTEQITSQDSAIFEEGWWENRANSKNEFMADAKPQTSKYPVM